MSQGKIFTFGLRVRDARRRPSAYSELLSLEKQVVAFPPRTLQAVVFEDHVRLTWEAPLHNTDLSVPPRIAGYHVYRSEEQSPPRRITFAPILEKEYNDADISFGRTYRYFIRALTPSEGNLLESDESETIEVKVVDTFPPAPPSGLSGVAGDGFIALSWEASGEKDLSGYRVWRREAGQEEFEIIAEVALEQNAYMDSEVEKTKGYDYAITALDKAGNESQRSAIISIITR